MRFTRRIKRHKSHDNHAQTGGIPIFAGHKGACSNHRSNANTTHTIPMTETCSKLEYKESAEAEMREYEQIKIHLKQIPNYQNYFSVRAYMCEPALGRARLG
jgi:hypothetical protein